SIRTATPVMRSRFGITLIRCGTNSGQLCGGNEPGFVEQAIAYSRDRESSVGPASRRRACLDRTERGMAQSRPPCGEILFDRRVPQANLVTRIVCFTPGDVSFTRGKVRPTECRSLRRDRLSYW